MRILIIALFSAPIFAQACPLGPGETTLTLARVMRNFSSYTLPADRAVMTGIRNPTAVKDTDIDLGMQSLKIATSCAHLAAADPTPEALWPLKARKLGPAERENYLGEFRSLMSYFEEALIAYDSAIAELRAQPPSSRDFSSANKWSREVINRAGQAHEILQ